MPSSGELYKSNGYRSIKFEGQGNVQEKIDNCFRNEIDLLKQLEKIKRYLDNGKKINENLKKMFDSNPLPVKLRYDIYKMMES